MLGNNFILGRGLGVRNQGLPHLLNLKQNEGTFGLGFRPSSEDRRDMHNKHHLWKLRKMGILAGKSL